MGERAAGRFPDCPSAPCPGCLPAELRQGPAGSGQAGVRQGPTGTKAGLKRAGIGALAGNTINFPVSSQRSIGRQGRPRSRDSRIMPCLGAKIIGLLINARHDCIMTRQLSPFPKLQAAAWGLCNRGVMVTW
ncbi:unnamed protein product [Calypogeia fissa]